MSFLDAVSEDIKWDVDGKKMTIKEWDDYTTERILNPRVGDRFTEMYSFWMYVVHIEEVNGRKIIYTAHFHPPCDVGPNDAKIYRHTQEGYQTHYFYGTGELVTKSWMNYVDFHPEHVENMLEEYLKLAKEIIDDDRYFYEEYKTRLDRVSGD